MNIFNTSDLDLTIFEKVGFGLDLSFFKRADLDLKIDPDLDLNIAGFTHHCYRYAICRTIGPLSLGQKLEQFSTFMHYNNNIMDESSYEKNSGLEQSTEAFRDLSNAYGSADGAIHQSLVTFSILVLTAATHFQLQNAILPFFPPASVVEGIKSARSV